MNGLSFFFFFGFTSRYAAHLHANHSIMQFPAFLFLVDSNLYVLRTTHQLHLLLYFVVVDEEFCNPSFIWPSGNTQIDLQ